MLKIPLGVARIKINVDAEVMELRLPKDRRIQTKSAHDLEAIAEKVDKPVILLAVVDERLHPVGSTL